MKAIRETSNELLAAYDKNDSVGIIDSHFPDANFFTEFERFDRHLDKLKRKGTNVDYLSICSPNYLHDAHIRFGLRLGADVICEKPLVLNPWNLEALRDLERESGKRIYSILQLRLHPSLIALRQKIEAEPKDKRHQVELTYITARGKWYYASWKGDLSKSGGIATNIGIHFFDLLTWLFGGVVENTVHLHTHDRASGHLVLAKADVKWFLSINSNTLPLVAVEKGLKTFRAISVDEQAVEFSEGFNDLHTLSYQEILNGSGFGLDTAATAVQLAHDIRNARPIGFAENAHYLAKLPLTEHPFA